MRQYLAAKIFVDVLLQRYVFKIAKLRVCHKLTVFVEEGLGKFIPNTEMAAQSLYETLCESKRNAFG
jgi:hypothetical protein